MSKSTKNATDDLIKKINILGPWVHGYFDLGNGLIIEDQDKLHKKRITKNKEYFVDIISKFYRKNTLESKTFCDVGCNAGFFLYELYRSFKFKLAIGLEPRKTNLAKARFIANYFGLPRSKYFLKQFDILTISKRLPIADIVIMPGVLHHVSNHLQALSNLYKMTRELCIVETYVLPDWVNSNSIAQHMSLGETLYGSGQNKDKFGIVGYKLETDRLDGATYQSGIVGITTQRVLVMMMEHVGFKNVQVYHNEKQMRTEVYNEKSYRQYNSVIITGIKENLKQQTAHFDEIEDSLEEQKFVSYIPVEYIEPLYQVVSNQLPIAKLDSIPHLIYDSEFHHTKKYGVIARKKLERKIGNEKYYRIIQTFKHSPIQKISFEYAKTCYHIGKRTEAREILKKLVKLVNLDWRTVFMSYYLLARINFDEGKKKDARFFCNLSLRAHPGYSLSLKLKKILNS